MRSAASNHQEHPSERHDHELNVQLVLYRPLQGLVPVLIPSWNFHGVSKLEISTTVSFPFKNRFLNGNWSIFEGRFLKRKNILIFLK